MPGAFSTLYEVLTTVSKLLAPFTPFIADDVYRRLCGESVHLQNYPKSDASLLDLQLEQEMANVLAVVELSRSIRNGEGIKVKQPLKEMVISVAGAVENYKQYNDIIQDELNIKACIWTHDFSSYETIHYKLNFKTAGAAFGPHVHKVKDYVMQLSEAKKNTLQLKGEIEIVLDNQKSTLLRAQVLKESVVKDHYVLAEENGCRVFLDTHLTDDLLQEGQIRELIRTIKDTRKKWQLPVEQYISISISTDAETKKIIQQYTALLKASVLLHDILFGKCNQEKM